MTYQDLLALLKDNADEGFRAFSSKILASRETLIGVRTPKLRKIVSALAKSDLDLDLLPVGEILEVDFVHEEVFLLREKGEKERYLFLESFLPKIDGWSLVDNASSRFKILDLDLAYAASKKMTFSKSQWVRRFGYVHLITSAKALSAGQISALIKEDDEYYVNMAEGWLLAEGLIYHFDSLMAFLRKMPIGPIRKLAVKKALESYRFSLTQKEELKSLR